MPQGSPHENDRPLPIGEATKDFFRFAVANVNDAVIVTTPGLDGPEPTMVYVNAAFERMTGYSLAEAVGQSPRILQGERTDRALLDRLREDLRSGRDFHGETVNYRKDGSEYFVEWRVSGVYDEGRLVNWVAIQRDVTGRMLHDRELEETRRQLALANEGLEARVEAATAELRRANEELAANNRDMATFTYTVSHDLRQPARAIISNAHFLEEDHGGELSPEAHALVERQTIAATRLGQLIDDLLKMSRLGRTSVVRERVDVTALVREVAETLAPESQGTCVRVQEGMAADASPSLLGVLYQNLLENAFKFRAEGRDLVVEAGRREDGAFFVRDNGTGFDQRYAQKVFEPFERLHRTEVAGTGFGLHNAQRVAEGHGGRMWAEGEEGVGATFLFTLE